MRTITTAATALLLLLLRLIVLEKFSGNVEVDVEIIRNTLCICKLSKVYLSNTSVTA